MIDSELRKVRDFPENSLIVEAYSLENVLDPTTETLNVLSELSEYVIEMANEVENIQDYLAQHPTKFSA